MNTYAELQADFQLGSLPFQGKGLLQSSGTLISANYSGPAFTLTKLIQEVLGNHYQFSLPPSFPTIRFESITIAFFIKGKTTTKKKEYSEFIGKSTITWPKPFGISTGLNLTKLGLYCKTEQGEHSNNAEVVTTAKLLFGGTELDAGVFFVNGKVVIIRVKELDTITVSKVFNHFFGNTIQWPTDFIDMTFTNSSVYYSNSDQQTYIANRINHPFLPSLSQVNKGLNIASSVKLFLGGQHLPTIDVVINIVHGKGVTIKGTFKTAIDFIFLKLTGTNFQNGPLFSVISYENKSFGLQCGFELLGKQFGTSKLTITRGIPQGQSKPTTMLSATLTYTGKLGPFNNPSLSFSYNKQNGFKIDNWSQIKEADIAIKWLKRLKEISKSRGCEALVKDIISNGVQVRSIFFISPQLTTKLPDNYNGTITGSSGQGVHSGNACFYIVLRGLYKISALSKEVCAVNLPTLVLAFTTPKEFNFNNIASAVVNNIETNSESILDQLWQNKAALAKFTAIFIGKKALEKAAAKGVCKFLKKAAEELINKLGSAGLAALGEGAEAALGAISGAIGAIGGACSSHHHSSGGKGGGTGISFGPLKKPLNLQKSYAIKNSKPTVSISWSGVSHADNYFVQIIGKNTNSSFSKYINVSATATLKTSFSLDSPIESSYLLSVIANPNLALPYFSSPPATILISQLGTPLNLVLQKSVNQQDLDGSFQEVVGATGYKVNILGKQTNKKIVTPPIHTIKGTGRLYSLKIPINSLSRGENTGFYIKVTALSGPDFLPGSAAISNSINLLEPIGQVKVGETFLIG
ncbi:hypothetical protein [Aquimarina longa]|uniref:hypothetical protein n=1 Tax=Aquimarina longa TaxID=1080221 RepID=UPI000784BD2E|nr:hypothetical protein [Aquimarina longa]